MVDSVSGNAITNDCKNTHIINELSVPLVALSIKDAVIVATPDSILVSDKNASAKIKYYVVSARPMYERRNWGEYKVLDYKLHDDGENSLVNELIIIPGQHISYQRHFHRTEIWNFIEGTGELILDGIVKLVNRGDVVVINPGTKHAIKSITELHIIEVQVGDELTEEDIERLNSLKQNTFCSKVLFFKELTQSCAICSVPPRNGK